MESRKLPRPPRAVAEWGHPRQAAASGRGNRLRVEPEELQDRVLSTGESREVKVPLERLVASEPTSVCLLRLARARAPPDQWEVAHAVFHAHTRVFERLEANINTAI
jgi:hypothetical protein